MTILTELKGDLVAAWKKSGGQLNLSSEMLEHSYNKKLIDYAESIYIERRSLNDQLEAQYISPTTLLLNRFGWRVIISRSVLVVEVPDINSEYELSWLKTNGISFIASNGEHTDDQFGTNPELIEALNNYIAEKTKPIGFAG